MEYKNIFDAQVTKEVIGRINSLMPETKGQWGTMTVAQMLAHCCVTYEFIYEPEKHPKPNFLMRFIIKLLAKSQVVGPKPYPKNGQTAPAFVIKEDKDFSTEKARLIGFVQKTQQLGTSHFDGKESHAMGNLSIKEWNTMFYKHIDHHLRQFGV